MPAFDVFMILAVEKAKKINTDTYKEQTTHQPLEAGADGQLRIT